MNYVLFNPLASNNSGESKAKEFVAKEKIQNVQYKNILNTDVSYFLQFLYPEDQVFVVGGGGTVLRLAQNLKGMDVANNIFFSPSGVGNDFFNDVAKPGETYTRINDYIKRVHKATVDGKVHYFLTDVGMGIDGYVCAVGERLLKEGKDFNYTMAAVKGLLGKYKPCGCSIMVDDGEEEYFENVWMASTLTGKMYGGGIKVAPTYDRLKADYLECLVYTSPSGPQALLNFPSIINGTHEGKLKGSHVFRGKKIEIVFTQPRDAQLDGDVIPAVRRYIAEF